MDLAANTLVRAPSRRAQNHSHSASGTTLSRSRRRARSRQSVINCSSNMRSNKDQIEDPVGPESSKDSLCERARSGGNGVLLWIQPSYEDQGHSKVRMLLKCMIAVNQFKERRTRLKLLFQVPKKSALGLHNCYWFNDPNFIGFQCALMAYRVRR